jgi:hypothetical protein
MNRQLLKDSFGWGFVLWVIGYLLGIVLFFVVPAPLIGWVIMPIGLVITLWVLMKKVKLNLLQHFVILAGVWTVIAVVLDYVFIVTAFSPPDGYYKLDVYLYYVLAFTTPLAVGCWKKSRATFGRRVR